jgi:hypothetical protein
VSVWIQVLRGLAYLLGVGGALLMLHARAKGGPGAERWQAVGAGCVVAMFVLFCATYLLYFLRRMARPTGSPPARRASTSERPRSPEGG